MARINSNVPSLIAQSRLAQNNRELELRLERLSTGLRINRGADDPAGLIISQRLRTDIQGVRQGIDNGDRASSIIATAEASLAEVSDLLNSIKSLIVASANLSSPEEREANQLQIDSAIDSITRISNTASFGGLKLLNGSLDYTLSGVAQDRIADAKVFGASFVSSQALQVDVEVLASAQTGNLFMRGDYGNSAWNGLIVSTTTLRIVGSKGVAEVSVLQSASLSTLVAAVNNLTVLTGVRAQALNPSDLSSGIVFKSVGYGSANFVSVERMNSPQDPTDDYFRVYKLGDQLEVPGAPPFDWSTLIGNGSLTVAKRDAGRDVSAVVNGNLATGKGLQLSINSPALSLRLLLSENFATDPTLAPSSFVITGGGALFQLGPAVNAQQQANLGIQSMAASTLGGVASPDSGTLEFLSSLKSGSSNSVDASFQRGDFSLASDILDRAIDQTSILRGRLGAFERNVIQTNTRSLQAAFENLSASESILRDADFAFETSRLTRAQILVSAGTSVLALANQQSQTALQLLG